jgi:hypothetical protein
MYGVPDAEIFPQRGLDVTRLTTFTGNPPVFEESFTEVRDVIVPDASGYIVIGSF